MDEYGFVYIQDRIKDMIISGENVYPAEIENVILEHSVIAEVAVIGQASERWGESPFALIVTKDDSALPPWKVLKRLLREQFPGSAPI